MASIKKLLSKKWWTGKDVGKTLIACLLHDLKHIDEEEAAPLLTQAEYGRMEASLETERDFAAYRVYVAMHESLREFYNKANSYLQQVYHGLYRIIPLLGNYRLARKEAFRKRTAPLLLTKKQYDHIKEKLERTFKQKVGTKTGVKFALLRAYLGTNHRGYKAAIPDYIQKELDAIAKKPATNKQALKAWQITVGLGDLVLPDGRYKGDLTPEEWQAALAQYAPLPSLKERADGKEAALYYEGAEAIRNYYKEVAGEALPDTSDEVLLLAWISNIGAPPPDDLDAITGLDTPLYETISNKVGAAIEGTSEHILTWKYYPLEEVEIPTKRELLEDCLEYYEGKTEGVDATAGARAFKKDYPALDTALERVLAETIPAWQKLTPEKAKKATITYGELATIGFLDYAEQCTPRERDIITACNPASLAEALAFVSREQDSDIDAQGNYKTSPLILQGYTLNALAEAGAEDMKAAVEALIMPAMKYVYAYNAWLDIIAHAYNIDDILAAKVDTASIEARLHAMNMLIYTFYLEAGNEKERELIKRTFTPLPVEELKPQEYKVEEAAQEIVALSYTPQAARAFSLVSTNATIKRIAGL